MSVKNICLSKNHTTRKANAATPLQSITNVIINMFLYIYIYMYMCFLLISDRPLRNYETWEVHQLLFSGRI